MCTFLWFPSQIFVLYLKAFMIYVRKPITSSLKNALALCTRFNTNTTYISLDNSSEFCRCTYRVLAYLNWKWKHKWVDEQFEHYLGERNPQIFHSTFLIYRLPRSCLIMLYLYAQTNGSWWVCRREKNYAKLTLWIIWYTDWIFIAL